MLCVHRPNLSLAITLVFFQGLASSGQVDGWVMTIHGDTTNCVSGDADNQQGMC